MLGDYELMTSLLPEVEYPTELSVMFIWYPNLMFLASPWLEIIDFQTSHFADSEQFKVDIYFAIFRQVKNDPIQTFLLTLDISLLFYWLWVRHAAKKQFKLSLLGNNSRTMLIRSGTSHFQQSIQWESRTGFFSQ